MAKYELNDMELESVNGGVAIDDMMTPGTTYVGTTAGVIYTHSVATADQTKFINWCVSLRQPGMNSADLDAKIFAILENPDDPNYPSDFVITKLDNPVSHN